jgi:hypothetical protein
MMSMHRTGILAAVSLIIVPPLAAQQTREALIRQARDEFDEAARLQLLARAADPGLGARDSLWAVGVFDLAQNLIGGGRPEAGAVWLSWVARHAPRWTIDRSYYSPSTIRAYDQAVPKVRSEEAADSLPVETSWRWPRAFDPSGRGSIEVATANPSVPLTVTVEGGQAIASGGSLTLQPGTYELVAAAPGFVTARVTREVLPGVTTVLEFDLPPTLPSTTTDMASSALVRIRYTQGGQQACANGFMARSEGLVLTTSGLQQTSGLQVETSAGVYRDVSIAATDAANGLAVLRVGAAQQPTLTTAKGVSDRGYAWSLFHAGCGDAASARTRLSGWQSPPSGTVALSPGLPAAATGSPLFDRAGALIGLVTGPDRVAPIELAQELLNKATQSAVAGAQVGSGHGGLPWVWIGAGAAAVGVAAAVLGGGGGGGGGGNNPPPATTGSITVTFPGVSP